MNVSILDDEKYINNVTEIIPIWITDDRIMSGIGLNIMRGPVHAVYQLFSKKSERKKRKRK